MPLFVIWMALGCTVTPAVEVGIGGVAFEDIAAGQDVDVVQGPQGGFHIVGSMRVKGIDAGNTDDLDDPSNPTTVFSVVADGVEYSPGIVYVQGIAQVNDESSDWHNEMLGRFVLLDIESDDVLDSVDIVLSVTVTDADGNSLTDARAVRAVPSPFNN